jgi:hypothetical protein
MGRATVYFFITNISDDSLDDVFKVRKDDLIPRIVIEMIWLTCTDQIDAD